MHRGNQVILKMQIGNQVTLMMHKENEDLICVLASSHLIGVSSTEPPPLLPNSPYPKTTLQEKPINSSSQHNRENESKSTASGSECASKEAY